MPLAIPPLGWFQFQTGSIRSNAMKEVIELAISLFQFQTGAIKSRYVHMCSSGTCARFNSKLVRLKVRLRNRRGVSIPNWFELEV